MLAFWAPHIYKYYVETMEKIKKQYPALRTLQEDSAFPAMSFNFGPHAATFDHTDYQNYAGGLCAVTAMGNFDPTVSGHLYFRELKLVVEFPPGSTVLIPSALIHHGNTALALNDQRYSVTSYAAGGLFRIVDQEFVTQPDMTPAQKVAFESTQPSRLVEAMGRFSTPTSLAADHLEVFGPDRPAGAHRHSQLHGISTHDLQHQRMRLRNP